MAMVPASGSNGKPSANARLKVPKWLASHGVPIGSGRLTDEGNPDTKDRRWSRWEKIRPGEDSYRNIGLWKPGDGMFAVCGVANDVLDGDLYKEGASEKWNDLLEELGDDGPDVYYQQGTPSDGVHLFIPMLGIGSHNGFTTGLDLKGGYSDGEGRGFVFIPPTVRFGKPYVPRAGAMSVWNGHGTIDKTREVISRHLDAGGVELDGGGSGLRRPLAELRQAVLSAANGGQRGCLLSYVIGLYRAGKEDPEIIEDVRKLVTTDGFNYPSKLGPWYPARGRQGGPDRHIKKLLIAPKDREAKGALPDADSSELEGISGPVRPGAEDEENFWTARPMLSHIRDSALAWRASPWAVLGEAMAEAICHTSPQVQLPDDGSLNILFAITGQSGAGKNRARLAARKAIRWHECLPDIPDVISRIGVGSGEGLVKCYGYMKRNDDGSRELARTDYSVVISIQEISTLEAISERGGATLMPELNKFYSGEQLGFAYSDPSKRIIIPDHEYRGAVIAGVQPGMGGIILSHSESGFAQRWSWFPAENPAAPDERPSKPETVDWYPPEELEDLDAGEVVVIELCATAARDIDRAVLLSHRGKAAELGAHSAFSRLKLAAGLALLDGRAAVSEKDWELSDVCQRVSDRTRHSVEVRLAKRDADANVARGRAEAVREVVREDAKHKANIKRIAGNVMKHVPAREGKIGENALGKKMPRDKGELSEVLAWLVNGGKLERIDGEYQGNAAVYYRRCRAG